MSLVGTRPPTVDEWDKYELHHRARLATKPGLTGMWQVSGRSNITDFEEVVKLDKQYISEWTIWQQITDSYNRAIENPDYLQIELLLSFTTYPQSLSGAYPGRYIYSKFI